MAQATVETKDRISAFLDAVRAEIKDLPDLENDWPQLNADQRAMASLEWDHLMADLLGELEDAFHADAMTESQRYAYRDLQAALWVQMPVIVRLGLQHPPTMAAS